MLVFIPTWVLGLWTVGCAAPTLPPPDLSVGSVAAPLSSPRAEQQPPVEIDEFSEAPDFDPYATADLQPGERVVRHPDGELPPRILANCVPNAGAASAHTVRKTRVLADGRTARVTTHVNQCTLGADCHGDRGLPTIPTDGQALILCSGNRCACHIHPYMPGDELHIYVFPEQAPCSQRDGLKTLLLQRCGRGLHDDQMP